MKDSLTARQRLIVALDCDGQSRALDLVDCLGAEVLFYKVGWRLFLQGGMNLLETIRAEGKDVFLDLKMDDIEETITTAVREISDRVMFLTIHGNGATARAALLGRGNRSYPKLLQVTLLSSLDQEDMKDLFGSRAPKLEDYVLLRAEKSIEAGCDGVIASGDTIKAIRTRLGPDPIIISPGIRPEGSDINDHKRSLTPSEALISGADYLVIGRPIHAAQDPVAAVKAIQEEMETTLTSMQK